MERRVVITGMGVLAPNGIGLDNYWNSLINGKSGIGKITHFDPTGISSQIAGEVNDFDPLQFIERKETKKMDRFIQFAIAGSELAVQDAQIKFDSSKAHRYGVNVGSGIGGLKFIEEQTLVLHKKGPRRVNPFLVPGCIINLASGHIAIRYKLKGPNIGLATACATGVHSIGESYWIIKRGDSDVIISGGAEACITPLGVSAFASMRALSTRNDEPQKASRPFDKNRDGFVIAEGAGVVILEELNHALRRNAKIYAEIIGYGTSCDAYHITAQSEDAEGPYLCMKNALENAKISPEEVEYINAHGTSTYLNDITETKAIKRLFGDYAYKVPISSTKSMTGHLLGAAGGIEVIATALTIVNSKIHPTINLEEPDEQCDLFYVPNQAIEREVNIALCNSFGFGGTNASIVLKKFEG